MTPSASVGWGQVQDVHGGRQVRSSNSDCSCQAVEHSLQASLCFCSMHLGSICELPAFGMLPVLLTHVACFKSMLQGARVAQGVSKAVVCLADCDKI